MVEGATKLEVGLFPLEVPARVSHTTGNYKTVLLTVTPEEGGLMLLDKVGPLFMELFPFYENMKLVLRYKGAQSSNKVECKTRRGHTLADLRGISPDGPGDGALLRFSA